MKYIYIIKNEYVERFSTSEVGGFSGYAIIDSKNQDEMTMLGLVGVEKLPIYPYEFTEFTNVAKKHRARIPEIYMTGNKIVIGYVASYDFDGAITLAASKIHDQKFLTYFITQLSVRYGRVSEWMLNYCIDKGHFGMYARVVAKKDLNMRLVIFDKVAAKNQFSASVLLNVANALHIHRHPDVVNIISMRVMKAKALGEKVDKHISKYLFENGKAYRVAEKYRRRYAYR